MGDELIEHKAVSQKASFQFLSEDISFFTVALYGLRISLCKFHKNSLSERLLEGSVVTL
ncbi:nef attachable domain protein [Chlamydia psittaci C1/97]|nr:nef attachable domain protein [Chlamydia psittaci C1/97]